MNSSRLDEFIARYGDRGIILLKAILEASKLRAARKGLGDFSFKDIKAWLAREGLEYNPSILLAKLEKEYGVIETSYKSSNQHWWVILDRRAIEEAVYGDQGYPPEESGSPMVRVLRAQFYSLEPSYIKGQLERMARARRLTRRDLEILREIAFNRLPPIARFLEESTEYPEALEYERMLAEEILDLVDAVISKLGSPRATYYSLLRKEGEPL